MTLDLDLDVLKCGNCEELKLGVHATALGIAALCGLYNAAAWLSRREQHLAVNAVLYAALVVWEQRHVVHHIAEIRQLPEPEPATTATAAVAPTLTLVQPPERAELAA